MEASSWATVRKRQRRRESETLASSGERDCAPSFCAFFSGSTNEHTALRSLCKWELWEYFSVLTKGTVSSDVRHKGTNISSLCNKWILPQQSSASVNSFNENFHINSSHVFFRPSVALLSLSALKSKMSAANWHGKHVKLMGYFYPAQGRGQSPLIKASPEGKAFKGQIMPPFPIGEI